MTTTDPGRPEAQVQPFEVTTDDDPFYSESNLAHLRRGVAALDQGRGVMHDLVEVSP